MYEGRKMNYFNGLFFLLKNEKINFLAPIELFFFLQKVLPSVITLVSQIKLHNYKVERT